MLFVHLRRILDALRPLAEPERANRLEKVVIRRRARHDETCLAVSSQRVLEDARQGRRSVGDMLRVSVREGVDDVP